ncbi:MAG: helix-turn-helix domain-containing protein, partial [Nitrospirota bacterium]
MRNIFDKLDISDSETYMSCSKNIPTSWIIMLRNEKELQAAKEKLANEKKRLLEYAQLLKQKGISEKDLDVVMEPLTKDYRKLQEEIFHYEQMKEKKLPIIDDINDIGKCLIMARKARGISIRELAKRLGVHESLVSRDERNGYKNVGVDRVAKILEALGATMASKVELITEKPLKPVTQKNPVPPTISQPSMPVTPPPSRIQIVDAPRTPTTSDMDTRPRAIDRLPPKEIIYHESVANLPVTRRILDAFPASEQTLHIPYNGDCKPANVATASPTICRLKNEQEDDDRSHAILALNARDIWFLSPKLDIEDDFEMLDPRIKCCTFNPLKPMTNGCAFRCQWCFLYGTYRGAHPFITIRVNVDKWMPELSGKIDKLLRQGHSNFNLGEKLDSFF